MAAESPPNSNDDKAGARDCSVETGHFRVSRNPVDAFRTLSPNRRSEFLEYWSSVHLPESGRHQAIAHDPVSTCAPVFVSLLDQLVVINGAGIARDAIYVTNGSDNTVSVISLA